MCGEAPDRVLGLAQTAILHVDSAIDDFRRAKEMGIEEGDLVEIKSTLRATKGRVALKQGIRPDTILIQGQFDRWVTPYSKDNPAPSMNTVVPMSLALTDSTGSSADIVRVGVNKLEGVI